VFFSTNTDVAITGSSAARFPGQCGDVCLCPCSRIEAVDGGAARIVDEIWFRTRDEVAQLIVSAPVSVDPWYCTAVSGGRSRDRDLGRVVSLLSQDKGIRVSAQEVIDGHSLRSGRRRLHVSAMLGGAREAQR
jgi:hypothetical protein